MRVPSLVHKKYQEMRLLTDGRYQRMPTSQCLARLLEAFVRLRPPFANEVQRVIWLVAQIAKIPFALGWAQGKGAEETKSRKGHYLFDWLALKVHDEMGIDLSC